MGEKRKLHPNSLANLDPTKTFSGDNDLARMAQKKSVEARRANKEARERLQITAQELKLDVEALMKENNITALDVLKLSMVKAIQNEDFDTAADLATKIAPYEAPKLQAIEQTNKEVGADELTDDELDKRLRALLGKGDS